MPRAPKTITLKRAKAESAGPKPMACRGCNKLKIYCSKEHPSCERCRARSIPCVYSGPKKVKLNEHTLRKLRAKVKRYEEIFKSLPPDILDSLPENSLGSPSLDMGDDNGEEDEELSEDEDEVEDSLPDQFRQMSIYLRSSRGSADNFLRTAQTLSGVHGDDGSLDYNPGFYDPRALPSRRQSVGVDISLPPIDIARQYFAAQHMYIGTIFSFTDSETFEKHLKAIYYSDEPHDVCETQDSLSYAKFLMILALGRLYSVNQKVDCESHQPSDNPPGFKYLTQALSLLPDVHEECSILGVETLAYVGYFMFCMNRRDSAYLYIGIALRMAITMGLHQESPESFGLSEVVREHGRRVWWSIYSLDRILSLKSGNPISIMDEDIGANKPSRLPKEPRDSPVVVLRHYTELSRILGDITTLIYRRTTHTGQSLVAAVHSILLSLTKWEDELPKTLRVELDRDKLSRESISMFLHYYQCINMTARPLLFHVVQKRLTLIKDAQSTGRDEKERDWRTGLSHKTAAVICGCITAARKTLRIMSTASQYGMVATYGYMDCEHAFSSAIVLVLVCGTFPSDPNNDEALGLGLVLLKKIGSLGNTRVAARYRLLIHLQSILSPRDAPAVAQASSAGVANAEHNAPRAAASSVVHKAPAPGHIAPEPIPGFGDAALHAPAPPPFPDDMSMSTFNDQSMLNFGFEFVDAPDITAGANMNMTPDEADSTFWATAFANPVDFDFSQLIPERDMHNYRGL